MCKKIEINKYLLTSLVMFNNTKSCLANMATDEGKFGRVPYTGGSFPYFISPTSWEYTKLHPATLNVMATQLSKMDITCISEGCARPPSPYSLHNEYKGETEEDVWYLIYNRVCPEHGPLV